MASKHEKERSDAYISDDEDEDIEAEDIEDIEGETDEDSDKDSGKRLHASADPFYDPDLDEEDERLLEKEREGRTTDAILSCPGCFSTLTVDCQAHETIHNRYRAMFVMNCEVDLSRNKASRERGKGGKGNAEDKTGNYVDAADELLVFHPVKCAVCGEEVGVMDAADEIYHFTKCLASNA